MIEITWQNIMSAAGLPLHTKVLVQRGQYGIMGELSGLGYTGGDCENRHQIFRRDGGPVNVERWHALVTNAHPFDRLPL